MTGEEGKGGGGGGGTDNTDNTNVINNANVTTNHQNGGTEKAPVVGGTNVETLPRPGKQVKIPLNQNLRFSSSIIINHCYSVTMSFC